MSDLISRKGVFIPDITVEMFRNASLESIEDLMASGEMKDILLPSAQPERTCVNCGRTAITRAENDEILNEAWRLLMNVTEKDGVTPEEANGMLKLMNFFFYKYHGLKKKPEWVESVEARLKARKDVVSKKAVIEYIKASDADLGHDSENELVVEDILNMPLVMPKDEPTEREEDE